MTTQLSIAKRDLPGKMLTNNQREQYVLTECKRMIEMAGTLRRSSAPEDAIRVLRAAFTVLLHHVYSRCIGSSRSMNYGVMMEELASGKYITERQYGFLFRAAAGMSEYTSSRSLTEAMQGTVVLMRLAESDDIRRMCRPPKRKSRRKAERQPVQQSLLSRWFVGSKGGAA